MKGYGKIFVLYSPIILLAGQVLANLWYMGDTDSYVKMYPYIATFFGFNMIAAVRSFLLSYYLKACKATRAVDLAQIFFGIFYMVFPDKEVYNLIIQVLVGIAALLVTFINFVMQYKIQWKQHKLSK